VPWWGWVLVGVGAADVVIVLLFKGGHGPR
jgi:hypothetical protein